MHFGKRLEQDMVPRWRPHYLQYKLLKKHIKELEAEQALKAATAGSDNAPPSASLEPSSASANGLLVQPQITYGDFSFPGPHAHRFTLLSAFKPLLLGEVEKVNRFTLGKVTELQNRVMQLLRTVAPWKSDGTSSNNCSAQTAALFLEDMRAESAAIAQDLVDLDTFIRHNAIATQKIVKKFDKRLEFDIAPWFHAELMEHAPFLHVSLDALLIALSDAYEKLGEYRVEWDRILKGPAAAGAADDAHAKGISAQSFERKNNKYWVRAEHLMSVKVAIIQNLPVYLFDRKPDGSKNQRMRPRNFLRSFDEVYGRMSDRHSITSIYFDNDAMDVYKTRMDRHEGAQLFRIRWYGDAQSLGSKEYIFMERKTHHESWVMAKSVKERFPIKPEQVQGFIEGSFVPKDKMKSWMKPDSTGLRLIKTEDELDKANELSEEIQADFLRLKMKPAVRTVYDRTAFQSREHNEVRISIDTQLMMVNEKAGNSRGPYPWCRDMVKSAIPPSDVLQFPYCILEVKLNCETTPPWIAGILANSQVVLERNKFSKFLTGIAYHHYEKIPELPYWFRDELALDPRNRFLSIEERERLLRKGDDDDDDDENRSLKPNKSSKALLESPSSHPNVHFGTAPSFNSPGTLVVPHSSSVSMPTSATERTPLLLENESDHTLVDTPRSSTSFLSSLRRRLTPSNPFSRVRTDLKPIRSNARIKIEPKTSFANERTLIQWVSAASLMITLGTLIVTSGSEFGFKAGFVFFPLAFLIMLYASIRYQYRAYAFRYKRQSNHDDLIGPMLLVFAISAAMGVIVYLMFQFNAPLPHMVPESGEQCKLMSNTGLKPYFAYSDVVTAEDGTTWVSGPFAIAQRAPGATAWQPLALTGLQVQSIDMHPTNPGQLILGVEKPDMSIVVLDTTDRTQSRQYSLGTLLQDYDISLKAMQVLKPAAVAGASTVPCTTDFDIVLADAYGSLFTVAVPATAAQFAQCMRKRTGLSASADLPAVNVTLELKDVMPGPRVTAGLIDDPLYKQVSALYHDVESDHLFVLFSQSRTLRALNMATGNVTRNWLLPGTSQKWTGLTIVKSATGSTLTLTQSTPGGVWQFPWTTDAKQSILAGNFPACANVYEGDLGAIEHAAASDRFKASRVRYVEDF